MTGSKRSVTFRDVARLAQVSPATVSRVAVGGPYISAEVRQRVTRAAASLGVSLDSRARSRTIALLLSNRDPLHPVHSRILAGAESYCVARGWEMVWQSFYYNTATDPADLRLPELLGRRGVARAVILGGTNSSNLFECLRRRALPFSVFGNNVIGTWNQKDEDVVFSDDVSGACEMVRYLLAQGHRRIWYVGDLDRPWIFRAGEGYRRAMQEAGLTPHLHGVSSSEERQVGYLATKQLLAAGERVSAILAGSDSTAEGVYRAIRDCGLRVPEDISVAGIDDTEGSILHPPLTTVHWFNKEVGLHLAELLLSRVANPDLPPRQITIPTQLVKRESCSGPAREPAIATV